MRVTESSDVQAGGELLEELETAGERKATPASSAGAEIAAAARRLATMHPSEWTSDEVADTFLALPSVPFDQAEAAGRQWAEALRKGGARSRWGRNPLSTRYRVEADNQLMVMSRDARNRDPDSG